MNQLTNAKQNFYDPFKFSIFFPQAPVGDE